MAEETTPAAKPATSADLKTVADLYHVPMAEETLKNLAQDMTPEKFTAFQDYIKTTAQGLYPTLAPQIKAGIPTSYLLDPYRQVAKQKLGDAFEPNFQTDPAAIAALTGGTDPQTGRPAPMSLEQWKQHIMSEPSFGYDRTPEAMQKIQRFIQDFHQSFTTPPGAQ
jgi:hypothetical protein